MSCVLRAAGEGFNVDPFLKDSTLKPLIVHNRDEPSFSGLKPAARLNEVAGMNVNVSVREFSDLAGQVEDAINFLLANEGVFAIFRVWRGSNWIFRSQNVM